MFCSPIHRLAVKHIPRALIWCSGAASCSAAHDASVSLAVMLVRGLLRFAYRGLCVSGVLSGTVAFSQNPQNTLRNPDKLTRASDQQVALLEEALWWLPADTETIWVSQGPFAVDWWSSAQAEKPPRNPVNATNHLRPHLQHALPDDETYRLLRGREVALYVEGNRNFDLPDEKLPGADAIVSLHEGCEIVVFSGDLAEAGDALMRALRKDADQVEVVADQDVARFDPDAKRYFQPIFFARPRPNVLLIATDRDYVAQVRARMTQRAEHRAIPENSPEWKYLDRRAPEWAIRHFSRTPKRDPTSPYSKLSRDSDSKAIGIVYAAQPGDTARVFYLSGAGGAMAIAKRRWGDSFGTPLEFNERHPGVVEISYTVDKRQALVDFAFALRISLGRFVAF